MLAGIMDVSGGVSSRPVAPPCKDERLQDAPDTDTSAPWPPPPPPVRSSSLSLGLARFARRSRSHSQPVLSRIPEVEAIRPARKLSGSEPVSWWRDDGGGYCEVALGVSLRNHQPPPPPLLPGPTPDAPDTIQWSQVCQASRLGPTAITTGGAYEPAKLESEPKRKAEVEAGPGYGNVAPDAATLSSAYNPLRHNDSSAPPSGNGPTTRTLQSNPTPTERKVAARLTKVCGEAASSLAVAAAAAAAAAAVNAKAAAATAATDPSPGPRNKTIFPSPLLASHVAMATPNSSDRVQVSRPRTLIALQPTSRVVLKPLSSVSNVCSCTSSTAAATAATTAAAAAVVAAAAAATGAVETTTSSHLYGGLSPPRSLSTSRRQDEEGKQDVETVSPSSYSASSATATARANGAAAAPSSKASPTSTLTAAYSGTAATAAAAAAGAVSAHSTQVWSPANSNTTTATNPHNYAVSNAAVIETEIVKALKGNTKAFGYTADMDTARAGVFESPGSSRTTTPTLVRTRPRLPVGLIQSRSAGGNCGLSQQDSTDNRPGKNILESLVRTDFVRKYSRKGRSTCGGVTSPISPTMSFTPRSPILSSPSVVSPPPESGQVAAAKGARAGSGSRSSPSEGSARTFSRLRVELEKMKQKQESDEEAAEDREEEEEEEEEEEKEKNASNKPRVDNNIPHETKQGRHTRGCDAHLTPESESRGSSLSAMDQSNHYLSYGRAASPLDNVTAERDRRSVSPFRPGSATPTRKRSTGTPDRTILHQNAVDSLSAVTGGTDTAREVGQRPSAFVPVKRLPKPVIDVTVCAENTDRDSTAPYTPTTLCEGSRPWEKRRKQNRQMPSPVKTIMSASDSEMSPLTALRLKPMPSLERDDESITSLHVTEDDDASSMGSARRRFFKDNSMDTEDEGVGALDIDGPTFKDTYSSVTRHSPTTREARAVYFKDANADVFEAEPRRNIPDNASSQRGEPRRDEEYRKNEECSRKLVNGRFLTHPPTRERDRSLTRDGGAVDSNGFGCLREAGDPADEGDLVSQASVASLDSHMCPSETQDYPTYHDVVQDVTSEVTDMEKLERKNSKTLKQKSKSDPSGEKQKEGIDLPTVISAHTNSTPLLAEERKDRLPHLPEFDRTEKDRTISKSDNVLASPEVERKLSRVEEVKEIDHIRLSTSDDSSEDGGPASVTSTTTRQTKKTTKKRQKVLNTDSWDDKVHHSTPKVEKVPKVSLRAPGKTEKEASASTPSTPSLSFGSRLKDALRRQPSGEPPSSPLTQSPEHTLDSRKSPAHLTSLTIPAKKGTSLTRSKSSASVFLHKVDHHRNASPAASSASSSSSASPSSSARPKDLPRKARPSIQELFGPGMKGQVGAAGSVPDVTSLPSPKTRSRTISHYSPSLEPILSQSTLSLFVGGQADKNKRDLIVQEFYSTEQQYVEALQMLVEKYMIPMKSQGVLDSKLVDDIFYKINEIYMHHAMFLAFLGKKLQDWGDSSTIGDVIDRNFSKQTVIESYMSFIENFPRAEKVLDDISTKGAFQRFIEQTERESRVKLPLKAQIVKPAQRIPRYELLLKRLCENTPVDHPDHVPLRGAEKAIHQLALKINSVKESKQEEDLQETLKKLELLLITDLVSPDRSYIRNDVVQVLSRKDQCCIWLFSDLAVFSSVKRKSGPVNRKTTLLLQSPTGNDFVENTKHKMWLKISLEDLEIIHSGSTPTKKELMDKDDLEEDFRTLSQISELTLKLKWDHEELDEKLHVLVSMVNKQLSDHQLKSPPPEANKVELLASTTDGLEELVLVFPTPEKRACWEAAFMDAKQKLAQVIDSKPPEFMQALQITKTRAGMQFSCASPIDGLNARQYRDVWVCNSDGYVGHMCLLSLQPEPMVTLNTPVPGCSSRILCICAVPQFQGCRRKGSTRRHGVSHVQPPAIKIDEPRVRVHIHSSSQDSSLSDSSEEDTNSDGEEEDGEEEKEEEHRHRLKIHLRPGHHRSRSTTPDRSGAKDTVTMDPAKSTMWMGTEDGCILIFPTMENIKTTKNKVKLQLSSGVLCIVHLDEKVFVSLANGDLIVYKRDQDGLWQTDSPEVVSISNVSAPINKMLPVAGKLWCACQYEIFILNPSLLNIESTFLGNPDNKKAIQCMALAGLGVCVAVQGSSKVTVYHAVTQKLLVEVSVAHAVAQKLQNADDIIRQHKTACLRVTALLACKDLLWVGTSAGVILTLPMPKISQATQRESIVAPAVTGLVHGHTGHVRFLTSVEMAPQSRPLVGWSKAKGDDESPSAESHSSPTPSWRSRRMSLGIHTVPMATKMLVISGGDGYEDFRGNGNQNEMAGRDDSTNHLLLWQV